MSQELNTEIRPKLSGVDQNEKRKRLCLTTKIVCRAVCKYGPQYCKIHVKFFISGPIVRFLDYLCKIKYVWWTNCPLLSIDMSSQTRKIVKLWKKLNLYTFWSLKNKLSVIWKKVVKISSNWKAVSRSTDEWKSRKANKSRICRVGMMKRLMSITSFVSQIEYISCTIVDFIYKNLTVHSLKIHFETISN